MALMELRSWHCVVDDSPTEEADRLSALPDDLLLLVLGRIGCAATAARTSVLSRRWRGGLWSRLRKIYFNDVAFPDVEAALGRLPRPPPAISVLGISTPAKQHRSGLEHRMADPASISSLLRAAASLEPEELLVDLPSHSGWVPANCSVVVYLPSPSDSVQGRPIFVDLPCFHRTTSVALRHSCVIRCVPAGVEFSALETLSLSSCTTDLDALLSCCPRLRALRLTDSNRDLRVNSPTLQELVVHSSRWIFRVDIVAPSLKQLEMSVEVLGRGISFSAPMVEEVSWCCRYLSGLISFGLWQSEKLELQASKKQGQLPSLHIYATVNHRNFPMQTTVAQEIEKHMFVAFSVLELHIETSGHVYGAWVFHLLAMNRIPSAMQRLKIVLESSVVKEECPIVCSCEPMNWIMNWRFQTISLTALEEVEINGFEAEDHEFYLLKLILRCAPMLKRMTVKLSQEVSSSNNECTEIYDIFSAYSTVECNVYLSSGLMHNSQNCPST